MKSETRKITEGAMMCALIAVFLILDRQFAGALTSYLAWVLSIPMILYSARYEAKYAWMVFVSTLFIAFMVSTPQSVFYLFSAMLLGVVYGQGVHKKWSQSKCLFWTIGITFFSYLISMYVFAAFFGYDLIATRNEFISMIENMEIFGYKIVLFMDAKTLFHVMDITSFLLLVVMESLCVHLLSHVIFIKMKMSVDRIRLDLGFVYPKSLAVGGLVSMGLMMLMGQVEVSDTIEFILAFFYLTLFIVNFIYGMIVVRCMRSLPKWCSFLCLIVPFLWPFVMLLGIADGLMDGRIRKRGLYGQTGKF